MVSDRGSFVRSQRYQDVFNEILFSDDTLSSFSNNESILSRLCPYQYDERVLELEDQLREEFWRVVDEALTDRQRQVIVLMAKEKMTQQEIAKRLSCNQSSIAKNLRGGKAYKKGETASSYGGSYRKLQQAVEKDERIQDILGKLAEIREERW